MPVEIKELIVKTTIDNSQSAQQKSKQSGSNIDIAKIKNELVDECVHIIMEQLQKNKER